MFESQLHERSSFITLTYSPENLPFPPSLNYKHFQDFMKRLRFNVGKCRFYMCGEYGDELARPHYHAALFGVDFSDDRLLWSKSDAGFPIYRSVTLEKLWPFGYSSIGDLTFESAAYIARYVMKKVTGDAAEEHYRFVDSSTGEIYQRVPEFAKMSLKPGIGGSWFDKYSDDVYNGHDYVVINGHKCRPPRYFDKLLRRKAPDLYQDVKDAREWRAYGNRSDNTDSRLEVKERLQKASLDRFNPRKDF